MKILSIPLAEKISRFSADMGGVFTFADLWNLIGLNSADRTVKIVNRLIREGVLFKVQRGICVTKDADLWVLACRLKQNVCISMDSVLSKNGLIGTIPERSVSLTYPGNTQTLKTPVGRIRFFKIKKELIFGTLRGPNGIIVADNEKAYLDLLYYYNKGGQFVADPLKDVSLWKLDLKKVKRYLRSYKNPKFRKFVEGLIHEN